jgi:hypothetical protein
LDAVGFHEFVILPEHDDSGPAEPASQAKARLNPGGYENAQIPQERLTEILSLWQASSIMAMIPDGPGLAWPVDFISERNHNETI